MVEFKLAIGDPNTKRTYKAVVSGADAEKLIGKKIGYKVRGEIFGLSGYELEITGGSDSAGFPMRKDVSGTGRVRALLSGSVGFKPKRKGQRKRKTVCGNTISASISQVNLKVVKAGKEPIAELLGAENKEEKESGTEETAKPKEQKESNSKSKKD